MWNNILLMLSPEIEPFLHVNFRMVFLINWEWSLTAPTEAFFLDSSSFLSFNVEIISDMIPLTFLSKSSLLVLQSRIFESVSYLKAYSWPLLWHLPLDIPSAPSFVLELASYIPFHCQSETPLLSFLYPF